MSGVSTGPIIARFTVLGPGHADTLREVCTGHDTRDLLMPPILSGFFRGAALSDTSGFRRPVDAHVDRGTLCRIAEERRTGRLLPIGTTDPGPARPVIRSIGEIAARGHADALALGRGVIEAPSAIPGALPPVPSPVAPRVGPIPLAAIPGPVAGSGTGDVFRLLAQSERGRVPIRMTRIPRSVDAAPARHAPAPTCRRSAHSASRPAARASTGAAARKTSRRARAHPRSPRGRPRDRTPASPIRANRP